MNKYKDILKNKSVWLSAMICMLVACNGRNGNTGEQSNDSDTAQIDTALVLHYRPNSYSRTALALMCNRDGETYHAAKESWSSPTIGGIAIENVINVGDTVIVVRKNKRSDPYIIRNLTMENKIRAFSRQR